MNLSHMIIVAIIILVVVPPEKLPEVMRTLGSLFNDIRRQTAGVWDDLRKEAAFKPEEILKPSDFTVKSLLENKTTSTAAIENKSENTPIENLNDTKSTKS